MVVLNCQKCDQFHKGHKSLGLSTLMVMVMVMVVVMVMVMVMVYFGQVMSPHHSDQMSQRSQVSGVTL